MARAISNALLQDLLKQSSSEGLVPLLTIDWNDGPHVGSLRLVLHDQDVTYGGNTFSAAAFGVQLPDEDDADVSMLQIAVQDVDLAVRTQIRQLDSRYPAVATLRLGLLSQVPTVTTIEQTFTGKIRTMKLGMASLLASVETFADISREPVTVYKMSPAYGFNSLRGR